MTMDSEMNIYTVNDYLINKVKFEMPIKALLGIMHDRELENGIDLEACDKDKVRLAYADMLKWFVLGPRQLEHHHRQTGHQGRLFRRPSSRS